MVVRIIMMAMCLISTNILGQSIKKLISWNTNNGGFHHYYVDGDEDSDTLFFISDTLKIQYLKIKDKDYIKFLDSENEAILLDGIDSRPESTEIYTFIFYSKKYLCLIGTNESPIGSISRVKFLSVFNITNLNHITHKQLWGIYASMKDFKNLNSNQYLDFIQKRYRKKSKIFYDIDH